MVTIVAAPPLFDQLVLNSTMLWGYVAAQYLNPAIPTFNSSDRPYLKQQDKKLERITINLRTRPPASRANTSSADISAALTAVTAANLLLVQTGGAVAPSKVVTKSALDSAVLALSVV